MFSIDHNSAIVLERYLRSVYGCDRTGVSGLADADFLENHPIQAAVLIVAFVYARKMEKDAYKYEQFLNKYINIFDHPVVGDAETVVKEYIKELREIVDDIISRS